MVEMLVMVTQVELSMHCIFVSALLSNLSKWPDIMHKLTHCKTGEHRYCSHSYCHGKRT